MSSDITSWALPRLACLLPLDDDSLREIITYTASLSKEEGADNLKNILGDSPQAFEFISAFNSRRLDVTSATGSAPSQPQTNHKDSGVSIPRKRAPKKTKPPLHNVGPVRQPEGYGDVTGGYQKSSDQNDYIMPKSSRPIASSSTLSTALQLSQQSEALQVPKISQRGSYSPSPASSRNTSPPRPNLKLPPSASGNLISDYLHNVKTKTAKKSFHSGTTSPRHPPPTSATSTTSIADLTSAISALELSTNPTLPSQTPRKCPCNATIHPLFTPAPNCLNCGKIICALEGLQPCSFCGTSLLSKSQVTFMIAALKQERGGARIAAHNTAAFGSASPMFPDSNPESSDTDSAASAARAHRDKLLSYQAQNARRTRIHDEAADYDAGTLTPGMTQWMTPVQRAAALKKQQGYIRELAEAQRPEWERKRTVMSVSVKNGKLVKTFEKVEKPAEEAHERAEDGEGEDMVKETSEVRQGGAGAFGKNPLLVGGELLRPIWHPPSGEADGKAPATTRERKSVWRRVQDDNDGDNEAWILDGGTNGFTNNTHEDGSIQECG